MTKRSECHCPCHTNVDVTHCVPRTEPAPTKAEEIDEMRKMNKAALLLAVACSGLLVSGCGRPADAIIADHKHLCDEHGGFYKLYAKNSHLPRLILCNDGTVKWGE